MLVDPTGLRRRDVADLILGLIVPRPIAWISTIGRDGVPNLAPFSFFNAFSSHPPTLAVGPGSRNGVNKDSLANIKATGEFVVSMVNRDLAVQANQSSAEFASAVDEWEVSGVTPAPCDDVAPPRVAESPAALECRVLKVVDLGPEDVPTNSIVIGRITRFHVDDELLDGYRVRPEVADLVGRMGRDHWCTTRDVFDLARPPATDPAEVRDDAPRPLPPGTQTAVS